MESRGCGGDPPRGWERGVRGEGEGSREDPSIKLIEPTHKKAVTIKEIIAGLSQVGAGEPNNTDKLHVASSLSKKNLERIRHSIPGGTWKNWPEELILNCHRKKSGQSYSSVYRKMSWEQRDRKSVV